MIASGKLRSRVTIMRPVGTTSATGGVIEGTPEVFAASILAEIETASAAEVLRVGALSAALPRVVSIRYLAGVKPWMTVTFEDTEFQIQSIVDVGMRHIKHQLFCVEIQ